MVYKYRAYNYPVPAQEAGEELERIEKKYGELTKENVLDESRKETAVLHKCFDWDDTSAAEKYRMEQARHLISNVVIVREEAEARIVEYRAYLDVGDRTHGRFINAEAAMSDTGTRQTVLEKARDELKQFKRKYATLKELAAVFSAIDSLG